MSVAHRGWWAVNHAHPAQREEPPPDVFCESSVFHEAFLADVSFSPRWKWIVCAFWFGLPLSERSSLPSVYNMQTCLMRSHNTMRASRSSRPMKNMMCPFSRFLLWTACTTATIKSPCARSGGEILLSTLLNDSHETAEREDMPVTQTALPHDSMTPTVPIITLVLIPTPSSSMCFMLPCWKAFSGKPHVRRRTSS